MKTSIIFLTILGILVVSCRPTLNVTETNTEQIEEKLIDYQKEESIGAEVTLLLKDGESISGELLSVRDSSVTVCSEYSATEDELINLKYPVRNVRTDTILELEIKGNKYPLWIGAGIGIVAGTVVYLLVKDDNEENQESNAFNRAFNENLRTTCLVVGIAALPIAIGGLLSTDNVTLTEIPPGYKFLPLKSLARYPDIEPEYLRAVN
jgi:hypothetical protein